DYHVENPFNSDVKSVNKKQIFELFPECEIRMRRVTLAPPISRKLAKYSFGACYFLESLKIFNTHYFGAIKKK
ncbi:MAG: hypothetical protein KKH94_08715, partial [Candidatus Omnitrophica bacterium]|nr:hypothetical protein [Candidatus Omnitrophota bacterium]